MPFLSPLLHCPHPLLIQDKNRGGGHCGDLLQTYKTEKEHKIGTKKNDTNIDQQYGILDISVSGTK
jgi:hypothetical protein